MKFIGIVGSEAAKFIPTTEEAARAMIRLILSESRDPGQTVVSGACHLGGVDSYAAEEGRKLGWSILEFPPHPRSWETGYKPHNIRIATYSEIVHCITVRTLPTEYAGMRFPLCYHCRTPNHVKSGGCWTARFSLKIGHQAMWHIISPDGSIESTSDPK